MPHSLCIFLLLKPCCGCMHAVKMAACVEGLCTNAFLGRCQDTYPVVFSTAPFSLDRTRTSPTRDSPNPPAHQRPPPLCHGVVSTGASSCAHFYPHLRRY